MSSNEFMMTAEDVDRMTLPKGIHATILSARDASTGIMVHTAIVWADRTFWDCPRCTQPIARQVDDCPVTLNGGYPGGQVEPFSQQHGCGEWLSADWQECEPEEVVIRNTALVMAAGREEEMNTERKAIRDRLETDLRWAITQLAAGESTAEEVTTGSDMTPGVYYDEYITREWLAWDYDPADLPSEDSTAEAITVTADELA